MSCSCSALNADSNDTKVDQDWQIKSNVRINDIYTNRKYSLSEWPSGLRTGLITAQVGFESQGDYCKKRRKITILIENAISFMVSHPSYNLFCGGAAWDLCEVPPH